MKALDRKLLRDLWGSRWMLVAVVSIVAVGVGCLVGFRGVYYNLQRAKSSYYAQCRMADFWVHLKKIPLPQTERAVVDGVSEIRHRISYSVIVDLEGEPRPLSGLLLTLPPDPRPVINNIILRSGDYFTDRRRNEVIVSEAFAEARGLTVGDNIHLILEDKRQKLFIVGTAISSEYVYMTPPGSIAPAPSRFGVFYVKREFAAETLGFQGASNSLVGLLTPQARRDPKPVLDEIQKRLSEYGVFDVTPLSRQSSNLSLSSEMGGLSSMAAFMPLIFLSVAALVLNVLMTRMAEQQRTVIGTFKALGYRNREVMAHFLKFGLIVGLLGALFGNLLGYWIAGAMTEMYKQFFAFPRLVNLAHWDLLFISAAAALVFSILGTFKGVRSVVALAPAEAMRPAAPPVGRGILLERWRFFWRHLNFRQRMVLRNIFRQKARSLIAVFASAMGAALLIATFGTMDALTYMLNFQFTHVNLSDYTLDLRNEVDYGAVYEAGRLPGVTRVEPVLTVPCTFQRQRAYKKGVIQGIQKSAGMTAPRDESGRLVPVPETGLLMTERLVGQLNAGVGDTITVVPTKGEQRPFRAMIAGTVKSMFGLSVYADYHWLNRKVGQADAVSSLRLAAAQTPAEKLAFLKEIKRRPSLKNYNDVKEQKKRLKTDFVDKMGAMIYPMIFFGAVIFFGAILNASLISIIERQREIAAFRVLGYHNREIGRVFLLENLILYMIGAVLGLPLGYVMLKGLALDFSNDLYSMPAYVKDQSWFLTLFLAVVFIFCCQAIIQMAVNRLDWNEALKLKE